MKRCGLSAIVLLWLATLIACGSTPPDVGQAVTTNPTATTPAASAPGTTPTTAPTAAPPAAPSAAPAAPPPTSATRSAGPAASTPPAAVPPTATRPAASPASPSAAIPQPNGPIPPGWQVFRGPAGFPVVIAYPPDWTVDTSLFPEQSIIFFYGPNGRDDDERIDLEFSQTVTGANIDVQRDEYFHRKTDFCDQKGIEYTEHRQISGATFAILGATCDSSNTLTFMQVAAGLTGGDEWQVLMRTPYDRKEARLREVFNPMLASLYVYAPVPR